MKADCSIAAVFACVDSETNQFSTLDTLTERPTELKEDKKEYCGPEKENKVGE